MAQRIAHQEILGEETQRSSILIVTPPPEDFPWYGYDFRLEAYGRFARPPFQRLSALLATSPAREVVVSGEGYPTIQEAIVAARQMYEDEVEEIVGHTDAHETAEVVCDDCGAEYTACLEWYAGEVTGPICITTLDGYGHECSPDYDS